MKNLQQQEAIADLSSTEGFPKSESFELQSNKSSGGGGLGNAERLIVIDSSVDISKQQIETFTDDEFAVLKLDSNRDGIKQLTTAIASAKNLDTIDILAHGDRGSLTLGNTKLNSDTLEHYKNELTGLAGAMPSSDILLYGCEVAAGEVGRSFVEEFGTLTGADIAASDDLTGSGELGGDWELEYQEDIEAVPLKLESFNSVLNDKSLLKNPGFEEPLDGTNWIIGKSGRVNDYDLNVEKVARIEEVEGQGKQINLKLPKEAQDNYGDQLAIFQDVRGLQPDKVYSVEAKVKWTNSENKLPSAIVSFWAKNPNNTFRGRDFTISDGDGYKNLRFEFTPNEVGTTRFFLGLFTHINGNLDDTEILVDDYKVTEIGEIARGNDFRRGNLLKDGNFRTYEARQTNWLANQRGWEKTASSSIPGLGQSMIGENNRLKLELPKARNHKDQYNDEFTGIYQNVELVAGQTYQLWADFQRLGLNKFADKGDSIVQFMAYRKRDDGEELFLGPIDVVLKNNQVVTKNFDLIAPDSGDYTILVRLTGWANKGNGVAVAVDNVGLRAK